MHIKFEVKCKAVAKGSMRAIVHRYTGKVLMLNQNQVGLAEYIEAIRYKAFEALKELKGEFDDGERFITEHIKKGWEVNIQFYFTRPKRMYNSKGMLKPGIDSITHITYPDIDKLSRAVLDALTGVVWEDDACVCKLIAEKRYAEENKTIIELKDIIVSVEKSSNNKRQKLLLEDEESEF